MVSFKVFATNSRGKKSNLLYNTDNRSAAMRYINNTTVETILVIN